MACKKSITDEAAGIVCFGNESEPFLSRGKWYVVNDRFGPIATDSRGVPLSRQPSGLKLQAAYRHWQMLVARRD